MTSFDEILRFFTVLIFVMWQVYWVISERTADREKPKTSTKESYFEKYVLYVIYIPLILQLLGIKIFYSPLAVELQVLGFILVIVGMSISVSARLALGTNWTHAAAYQIKTNHTLVTRGIYSYIRHPIYTGLFLALVGASLVAQSYLFVAVGFFMLFWAYRAGKREEKILEGHFGNKYTEYKKRSKMLIPFVF